VKVERLHRCTVAFVLIGAQAFENVHAQDQLDDEDGDFRRLRRARRDDEYAPLGVVDQTPDGEDGGDGCLGLTALGLRPSGTSGPNSRNQPISD
jgi:hypothetical protein